MPNPFCSHPAAAHPARQDSSALYTVHPLCTPRPAVTTPPPEVTDQSQRETPSP
ncbi:hypothetical protein HMPREF9946_00742 [Acetobacteraceae bacterium AT-5844]|nr:hypothetical protein HMPREF9946_00742 [Acetobacteraceae bacterium AT-5844]